MRINGLIRAFNSVRSQLQAGIRRDAVDAFRRRVAGIVGQVEEMCAQHGQTPVRLPAPSRRAYFFLKGLDLNNLPVADGTGPALPATRVRIKNILSFGDYFAVQLWRHATGSSAAVGSVDETLAKIRREVELIERLCRHRQATPSYLVVPSRQVYCWLKFLADDKTLGEHLEALRLAHQALAEIASDLDRPVQVQMVNLAHTLWRKRSYREVHLLKVSEGFLNASPEIWRVLLHTALVKRDPDHDRLVREFAHSEEYGEVLLELESMIEPDTPLTQGRVHSLDASFDRVNATYFGGALPKPVLVWNQRLTARIFGHYQPTRDRVMLSVSLDDATVPASVVDFVMYHELLHKKHGVPMVNGRRIAHSPAFRAEERRFKDYAEAQRQLENLARRQRSPHR